MSARPYNLSYACPKCGQADGVHVEATATVHLDADGATLVGDYDWDPHATATCPQCLFESRLTAFETRTAVQP
jgi:hypothetical protein